MDGIQSQVESTLDAIESELRRLDLWSPEKPAPGAYLSQVPFCHDTMTFAQWLQFVLIERMHELIRTGKPLPTQCAIAPYAEEALKDVHGKTEFLVLLIRNFDACLSQRVLKS